MNLRSLVTSSLFLTAICLSTIASADHQPTPGGWDVGGGVISTRPTPTFGGPGFGNGGMMGDLEITCASYNGGYQECPAFQQIYSVWLIRDNSEYTRCVQGSNWGYTYNSVWVSNGCEGVFAVQTSYNPYPQPQPHPHPQPGGYTTCETYSQGQTFTASAYDLKTARRIVLRECNDTWGTDMNECRNYLRCY